MDEDGEPAILQHAGVGVVRSPPVESDENVGKPSVLAYFYYGCTRVFSVGSFIFVYQQNIPGICAWWYLVQRCTGMMEHALHQVFYLCWLVDG